MSETTSCPRCGHALAADLGDLCPRCIAEDLSGLAPPTSPNPDLGSPPQETVGAEPFGKYLKVKKVGAGAMGEVWKAWDPSLRRWVALKFLKGDESDLPRFIREGRTAAGLNHPHIAVIYETGSIDGKHYIAMQYVEGRTLEEHSRLDRAELVSLIRDVARAVDYGHRQGVVHRDLKPGNLIVERPEQGKSHVYVTDFGLARQLEAGHTLSISGVVLGTPSYMSPEQARGEAVDARSDVYSLGATVYDLLAHRPPIVGRNIPELLEKLQKEEPRPLRDFDPRIDRDLETITLKCLEKDPARRYESARALADDLDRFLRGETIVARPASLLYKTSKFVRRHTLLLSLGTAALLTGAYSLFTVLGPASMSIESMPPGAAIRMDGRETGRQTPATVLVWPPGPHLIELVKPGYERLPLEIVARAGSRGHHSAALVRLNGTMTVHTTPSDVQVELESEGRRVSLGRTPLERAEVARGTHRVILLKEGYDEIQEVVDVHPDQDSRVERALVPETGQLSLSANVDGVTAKLHPLTRSDGLDQLLSSPALVGAATGRYRVTFEKENHHAQTREVALEKGRVMHLHGTVVPMQMWIRSLEPLAQKYSVIKAGKIALADCDGDGVLDVLLIHKGGVAALSGQDGAILWDWKGSLTFDLPVALADLDGDGTLELLLGGPSTITALSARDGRPLWEFVADERNSDGDTTGGPVVADVDGDGVLDCLTGWRHGGVYAVSGKDGSRLWSSGGTYGITYLRGAIFVRTPQGGAPPSVGYPKEGMLRTVSGRDGSLLRETPLVPYLVKFWPLGDIDGDGIEDFMIPGAGLKGVSGADGHVLWEWQAPQLNGMLEIDYRRLDVDGDGVPDFGFAAKGEVILISGKSGRILWATPIEYGDTRFLRHASADLNGDGVPDFVICWKDKLTALSGKDGRVLWSFGSENKVFQDLVLGDLTGDGRADCAVETTDGRMIALSGRDGSVLWRFRAQGGMRNVTPVIGDIDGDGMNDVVFWGENGVCAISGNPAPWAWQSVLEEPLSGPIRSADVNGDGVPDCVVGSSGTIPIRALSGVDGSTLWEMKYGSSLDTPLVVGPANFDGDGVPDWIVSARYGRTFAVSGKHPRELWKFSIPGVTAMPVVADFDRDGLDDCLLASWNSSQGSLTAVSGRDGRVLWSKKNFAVSATPAIADFNGDGIPDCLVRSNDHIALSGKDGSEIWKIRAATSGECSPHPMLADIDGDGIPDIVASRTPEAFSGKNGARLWKTPVRGHLSGAMAWIGDVDGDGVPDLISPTSGARGLRICVLSGRDGSLIYDIPPPETPVSLHRAPIIVPFSPHMHSDVMSQGWRLQCLVPSPPAAAAVVVLESHVFLLDRRTGRLLNWIRGAPPMSAALASTMNAEPFEIFIGEGRTVRKVRLAKRPSSPPFDFITDSLYFEGMPALLASLRHELGRECGGHGIPELCDRLLQGQRTPALRRFLLARRAEHLFLDHRLDAAIETLDQLLSEGGDSYFPYALRYACRPSVEDLRTALLREPAETCHLLSRTDPPTLRIPLPDLLAGVHGVSADGKLARAAACILAGHYGTASEYLYLALGSGRADCRRRLEQLVPSGSARSREALGFTRTIHEYLAGLPPNMTATLNRSDTGETALLGVRTCLDVGRKDQAVLILEEALGDEKLEDWKKVLEQLHLALVSD